MAGMNLQADNQLLDALGAYVRQLDAILGPPSTAMGGKRKPKPPPEEPSSAPDFEVVDALLEEELTRLTAEERQSLATEATHSWTIRACMLLVVAAVVAVAVLSYSNGTGVEAAARRGGAVAALGALGLAWFRIEADAAGRREAIRQRGEERSALTLLRLLGRASGDLEGLQAVARYAEELLRRPKARGRKRRS
jgi:hypothetical protein